MFLNQRQKYFRCRCQNKLPCLSAAISLLLKDETRILLISFLLGLNLRMQAAEAWIKPSTLRWRDECSTTVLSPRKHILSVTNTLAYSSMPQQKHFTTLVQLWKHNFIFLTNSNRDEQNCKKFVLLNFIKDTEKCESKIQHFTTVTTQKANLT